MRSKTLIKTGKNENRGNFTVMAYRMSESALSEMMGICPFNPTQGNMLSLSA